MGDPTVFYGAWEGGADYDFVKERLAKMFKQQGIVPSPDSFAKGSPALIRPVCLIFGRPSCKVFKEELLPDERYFDLRSGQNVELFYMGFANPDEEFLTVGLFDEDRFSDVTFVSAVEDFERRTKWRYSGQTDAILLNSFFSSQQNVYLDFTNVFSIQIEEAFTSKLFPSGRSLIEEIIRASARYANEDVVARVSDEIFLKNARRTFASWVMGLIKLKSEDLDNAYSACVRDVSRRSG